METKLCQTCNNAYTRKNRQNLSWWNKSKYCSRVCSGKAKVGLPGGMKGKTAWNKEIPMSKEQRELLSEVKKGCTPWNKGLGTTKGPDVRNTRKYKIFRISILVRDEHTCTMCGSIGGRLEVDHIKSVKFFPDLVWDGSNVRTLCRGCHKKTDNYGIKVFKYGDAQ